MNKAIFTVTVEYDPEATDSESLASALDTLMETAMSTPGVLDEYGNPSMGVFHPLGAKIEDLAPEVDGVHVNIGGIRVIVKQYEDGETEITVHDPKKGSTQRIY